MAIVLAVGAVAVVGLRHWPVSVSRAAPVARASALPRAVVSATSGGGVYSLVQLPQDGLGAIYRLVASARRSIDLEI